VTRQMTGSREGLVAAGNGADMFPGPLGGLEGMEIFLVGGVVVGGCGEKIGVSVLAGGGVGLHVARQLVGSREALVAARKVAGVGLLADVGADVSRLMLETEEGLVAEMALVGAGDLF
jgi:hypothetical protein